MKAPPTWQQDDLETERQRAADHFREGRHTEPLELYLDLFDQYQSIVEEVMEETVDLTQLRQSALDLMTDDRKREVLRYLSGPPVSEDDLKVLMRARSLSASALRSDRRLVDGVVSFMRDWHDRRRFPWLSGDWTPVEHERNAAILATAALLAMRRVETLRRHEGKRVQEQRVENQLIRSNFKKVKTRRIGTLSGAPKPGEFCRESHLGSRKADFVIGLRDGRTLALECKVSNSATNSVKRLNNDAAVKAEIWRHDFGQTQIVTGAVLSGVYALTNLLEAQARGLTLFWAHDLQAMADWIHSANAP